MLLQLLLLLLLLLPWCLHADTGAEVEDKGRMLLSAAALVLAAAAPAAAAAAASAASAAAAAAAGVVSATSVVVASLLDPSLAANDSPIPLLQQEDQLLKKQLREKATNYVNPKP